MGNCTKGEEKATKPTILVKEDDESQKQQQQQSRSLESKPVVSNENKATNNKNENQQDSKNVGVPPSDSSTLKITKVETASHQVESASTTKTANTTNNQVDSSNNNDNNVIGGAVTSPFRNRAREHVNDEQQQQQTEDENNNNKIETSQDQQQQHQHESSADQLQSHHPHRTNVLMFNEDDEFDQNPYGNRIQQQQQQKSSIVVAPVASNYDFHLTPFQRNRSFESQIEPPRQQETSSSSSSSTTTIIGGLERTHVFPCFEGGLLYRLVGESSANKIKKTSNGSGGFVTLPKSLRPQCWYFYNDTLDLDMKIEYSFGPTSKIEFGKDVSVVTHAQNQNPLQESVSNEENKANPEQQQQQKQQNWIKCSLVVKPGETKLFIIGIPNGYQSSYSSTINEKFFVVSPTSRGDEQKEERNYLHPSASSDSSSSPSSIIDKPKLIGENKRDIEAELDVVRSTLSKNQNNKNNNSNADTIQQFVEESVSRARNRNIIINQNERFLSPTRIYGENTFCLLPSSSATNVKNNNNNHVSPSSSSFTNEPIEISIRRTLHQNQLQFVDLQFPPSDESLFRPEDENNNNINNNNNDDNNNNNNVSCDRLPSLSWSRVKIPKEGLGRHFVNNETSVHPSKVDAGVLGDYWLTSALITLADACPTLIQDKMFVQTYDEESETTTEKTSNVSPPSSKIINRKNTTIDMVQVSINKAGWWRDVLLDNFLPMSLSRPAFARPRRFLTNNANKNNNNNNSSSPSSLAVSEDFWVSFAQKAMAKVHGSYGSLVGGDVLHALQDLSGYPTTNLNELWNEVTLIKTTNLASLSSSLLFEKEKYLFDRISRSVSQGHIVMLTAPGLDEEILEECISEKFAKVHPEVSNNKIEEFIEFYKKKFGLGLGISYSVKYVYTDKNVTLLHLLNCAGSEDSDLVWKGDWSKNSDMWKKYPNVEKVCRAVNRHQQQQQQNDNNSDESDEKSETYFWISWEDCKKLFTECGICYIQRYAYETRVVGFFGQDEPRVPSVILELKNASTSNSIKNNKKKNHVTAMLSQIDSRGLRSDHPQAHGAAMLMSLFGNDEEEKGWYRLIANSTQDIERQTTDKFEYTFIRDISMTFNLLSSSSGTDGSSSPCYLVPRIHEKSRKQDTFYCVSIFSSEPLEINFRSLSGDCSVFKNAKAVSHQEWNEKCNNNNSDQQLQHVQYQVRNLKTGRIENF